MTCPWGVAAILAVFVSHAALQPEGSFPCGGVPSCPCTKYVGYYELLCHNGTETTLTATVRPFASLEVECTPRTPPPVVDLLAALALGPVDHVDFRLCPLPTTPIAALLRTTSAASLKFQSYRDLGGAFETRHLAGMDTLTKLFLMNNNLTDLPEDLLRGLPNLTRLDLRENSVRLPKRFFEPVPDLEFLELGENKLAALDPPLLSNLANLRQLNLWKNNLRNLSRDVFSGLTSLEELDVSSNSIVSLPSDVFRDLKNLVHINLSFNNFTNLPRDLLADNRNLEIFRLHDNREPLVLGDAFLGGLSRLKEVQLMRNNVTSLPENLFWGSTAVTSISLRGNALSRIPQLLFRDQAELQTLDLSENYILSLPDNGFRRLGNLHTLKLGFNEIERISREVFNGLYSLKTLEMNNNKLSFVDSESLTHLSKLKTACFAHNRLSFLPGEADSELEFYYKNALGTISPFRNCGLLEDLNLSNNSITEIFTDWKHTLIQLRNLDLSYNKIESLSTGDIHFLGQNLTVDLRHNRISVVSLEGLEYLALSQDPEELKSSKSIPRLLLDGNPLNCDCHAYDLFHYLERRLNERVYYIVTLEPGDLRCSLPAAFSGLRVGDVKSRELTCPLNRSYNCPTGCFCFLRRDDLGLIVNCSGLGLTEVPRTLPEVGGTNHTELHLDGNYIGNLPNRTFPGYENVTHLHLSSNNISNIGTGMLSPKLEVLTLDDNNLTSLSSNTIKFLYESQGIRTLKLHNNPWRCDCSARELLDLIQQKFKEIPYLSNVTCSEGKEPLSKLSVSDLCPVSIAVIVTCIAAAVFGLLVGIFAALYYRYQREVKVWLYSHHFCLWFVTEEELDRDKLYDAFVSYSHKDEHFVVNTLVPELESGENPFKLCLHYRDWIAGEWIPNQIARSVENSRRTLVVLSPNFLESVWSRMEFRAAHKQALSEGRARVIVVLYGDVGPTEDLDPELRAYISMNTYVKWGDPWFWGKLKYALPHPPSLIRTNLNFFRRRTMKKEKSHIDDKLELIHRLDPSGSPAGGTTPPIDAVPNGNAIRCK